MKKIEAFTALCSGSHVAVKRRSVRSPGLLEWRRIGALLFVVVFLMCLAPHMALADSPPPIPSFTPSTPSASETTTDTTDTTTTTTSASTTATATSSGPADIALVIGLAVVSVWSLKKYFYIKKYSL